MVQKLALTMLCCCSAIMYQLTLSFASSASSTLGTTAGALHLVAKSRGAIWLQRQKRIPLLAYAASTTSSTSSSSPSSSSSSSSLSLSTATPAESLPQKQKTGVLCHGYHLDAAGWEEVMFGKGKMMGRLAKAAEIADKEDACIVIFGSGASRRDGVFEGQYGINYLLDQWNDLRNFDVFAGKDLNLLRKKLEPILVADSFSGNTRLELITARRRFIDEGCTRVILISSPTHLPRCVKEACAIFGVATELGETTATVAAAVGGGDTATAASTSPITLYACPSDTSFPGTHPSDIAIVEPPHLPHHLQALTAGSVEAVVGNAELVVGAGGVGESIATPGLHVLTARALKLPLEKKLQFQQAMHTLLLQIEQTDV